MIAFIDAYRAGLLKLPNWGRNIIAGLIVGIVALPLAMAFAIASGARPEQGLYTAIIAALAVGIFGGSRVQIAGPTGAFIVILASITAQYGIIGLQIASLMAGALLILMGLLRLGNVIKFIPEPVIVGFTSGIGVIIWVGEWKDFFGLNIHLAIDAHFHQKIMTLIMALPTLNVATTLLGILSVLLVIFSPKFLKRIPGPLVVMVVVTILQATFHFNHVATLGTAFGKLSSHLPSLHWPAIDLYHLIQLAWPALTIALLGAIESLLSATAADGLAGTRHNANQELIGQGLANIIAPLFNGIAATGAIARTATNVRNGGNCAIAAITHSVFLILVIVLLAPLASNIPLCSLAAILFVVAYYMSDIPHFIRILKKAPFYDVITLLTTFLLTVFINLVVAVNVGVLLAMIFFIYRMNQTTTIKQTSVDKDTIHMPSQDIMVYELAGPFYFGVAEKFERALAATHTIPKIIILQLEKVPFIDITGLETFHEIIQRYCSKGIQVYLCGANATVSKKLNNVHILDQVVDNKIFSDVNTILQKI